MDQRRSERIYELLHRATLLLPRAAKENDTPLLAGPIVMSWSAAKEFLENREYGLALEVLIHLGHSYDASGAYWYLIDDAADLIGRRSDYVAAVRRRLKDG